MNKWITIGSVGAGIVIVVVGIILKCVVFPNLIQTRITENVQLKDNTDQFNRFKELPIPVSSKSYVFHIKNRDAANRGEKPEVVEKGPYIYRQTRKKEKIVESKNNTISYFEYQHYEFDEKASGILSENDKVTVLNSALNGVIQILETMLPDQLKYLNDVTELVFSTKDIYLDITIKDLLFGGYRICNREKIQKEPDLKKRSQALLLCLGMYALPVKNIKATDDELIFTFLNHKNTTHNGHFTVNSGLKDINKLGIIEEWEYKKYTNFWKGKNSKCDKVRGRDSTIYPPFLNKDMKQTVFNTDICRSLDLLFNHEFSYRDVTAYQYTLDENTFSPPDPKFGNECYCLKKSKGINYGNGCLKTGVLDLFTCYNAPIVISFPHFLWADYDYKNSVRGLNADEEKHKSFINIEPKTGSPLSGSKRVQFNMFVRSVGDIEYLKNYHTTRIVPIIWIDESVEINDKLYDELYESFVKKMMLTDGISWGLIGLGLFIIIVAIAVCWWKRRSSKQYV